MIRLVYPTDPNFGDQMSPLIVEKLSGHKVKPSGMWNADMMAVGSVFYRGDYFMADTYHSGILRRLKAVVWDFRRITSKPVIVWGAGFLQYPPFKKPHIMRKFKILALRGKYTRRILENFGLMTSDENIVYGDPGLLFADLFNICTNIQYEIGIIPHIYDAKLGWKKKLNDSFNKVGIQAKIIDVTEEPYKVVSEIAKCRKIISSSLHGIIVADSLGIPNLHIKLSTFNYSNDDFELKFRDYYSALGENVPLSLSGEEFILDPKYYIKDFYYHIANKKNTLRKSFPFHKEKRFNNV